MSGIESPFGGNKKGGDTIDLGSGLDPSMGKGKKKKKPENIIDVDQGGDPNAITGSSIGAANRISGVYGKGFQAAGLDITAEELAAFGSRGEEFAAKAEKLRNSHGRIQTGVHKGQRDPIIGYFTNVRGKGQEEVGGLVQELYAFRDTLRKSGADRDRYLAASRERPGRAGTIVAGAGNTVTPVDQDSVLYPGKNRPRMPTVI